MLDSRPAAQATRSSSSKDLWLAHKPAGHLVPCVAAQKWFFCRRRHCYSLQDQRPRPLTRHCSGGSRQPAQATRAAAAAGTCYCHTWSSPHETPTCTVSLTRDILRRSWRHRLRPWTRHCSADSRQPVLGSRPPAQATPAAAAARTCGWLSSARGRFLWAHVPRWQQLCRASG